MPIRHARFVLLCFLAICLGGPREARAHDAERTQVSLTFATDGSFVLDVANDPNWLLLRLEGYVADYPSLPTAPQGPLSDAERDARLRTLAPTFTDRIVMWVDGREIRPTAVEYVAPRARTAADDVSPRGVYRLRGRMPLDARTLQWFYGLVIDPYPLSLHRADVGVSTETILGNAWSRQLDLSGQFHVPARWDVARHYASLGYGYILPRGVEQLLFVLGLLLLRMRLRPVLLQLATFAAASSLALALAMFGVVSMSPRLVDSLIALSVAYVALENLATSDLKPWRLGMVFFFGVFHGLRLANVLNEVGVPSARFLTGLATFDAGAAGALLTAAALASLVVVGHRHCAWYHQRIVVPVSLAIAGVGVYWTIALAIG